MLELYTMFYMYTWNCMAPKRALHPAAKLLTGITSIKGHALSGTCGTYIYWFDCFFENVFINMFWIWKEKIPLHNNVYNKEIERKIS